MKTFLFETFLKKLNFVVKLDMKNLTGTNFITMNYTNLCKQPQR